MTPAATSAPPTTAHRSIPWHMCLPGPVFSKEVWMLGKRPSTGWLRLAFISVLLFVVGMVFMGMMNSYASGAAAQLQRYQRLAPAVTMGIVWVEFVMLSLIGVALAGPAICEEKRMGTLSTLLTTPLKAWQIVLGKSLGRLVELIILALAPLPLMLALRSFGGVSAEAILTMTGTCIANAILAVQIGIFVSAVSKRTTGAIVLSLIFLGVVMFGPMLATWAVIVTANLTQGGSGGPPGQIALGVMLVTCSPMTLVLQSVHYLFGESAFGGRTPVNILEAWGMHMAYLGVMWGVFFFLSCVVLRRVMAKDGGVAEKKSTKVPRHEGTVAGSQEVTESRSHGVEESVVAGSQGATLPAVKRSGRRRLAPVGVSRIVGDAPVMWRELKQGMVGSRAVTVVAGLLLTGLLGFVYYMSAFNEPMQQIITAIGAVICVLSACVLSTGTISQERESRTLEALLCTPLSAWDIVWGKFLGSARRASLGLLLVLGHILVGGVLAIPGGEVCRVIDTLLPSAWWSRSNDPDMTNPLALFHVAITLGSTMCFLLATGILFSTRFKKSTSATVMNFAMALALWAALPAFVFVVTETALDSFNELGNVLQNAVIAANPVPTAVIAVDGATSVQYASGGFSSRTMRYDMPHGNWNALWFTLAQVVVALAYLALAWLALRLAARTLANETGRRR